MLRRSYTKYGENSHATAEDIIIIIINSLRGIAYEPSVVGNLSFGHPPRLCYTIRAAIAALFPAHSSTS